MNAMTPDLDAINAALVSLEESGGAVVDAFEQWRARHRAEHDIGLAWFLAARFCRAFHTSHGIMPHVIERDDFGYYGIERSLVPCPGRPDHHALGLGRMTMMGNVENWRTGSPGDHGLTTATMCDTGAPTVDLVRAAFFHMGIPDRSDRPHVDCEHFRDGSAYVLRFEAAAIAALKTSAAHVPLTPEW